MSDGYVTLRGWFDEFNRQTGELNAHVCFGWGWYEDAMVDWPSVPVKVVLAVGDVPADVLDHRFSDGFGGNDSPNLCAWSPSWVLFSDNYDGAESLRWVPRNPADHDPIRPGGG